ncbi:Tetratricopeptide repeat protein [Nymphaea thermarum]|nr:Tetratricopeptide repeat protein [Nymphaea thermarum]
MTRYGSPIEAFELASVVIGGGPRGGGGWDQHPLCPYMRHLTNEALKNAVFLWEKGEDKKVAREKAAEHLVLSVKLNPSNGAAFRLLGHYYSQESVDLQRSSKCYQRAITINPDDNEAGEALCNLLDRGGNQSLQLTICHEVVEKSSRAFWAWRRLGYLQVAEKMWSDAVQSLQHAIRGYPTCPDLWEALGLAYQRLGMFSAALKAVDMFREAAKIAPQNVSAHYGLASALLGMSRDCINSGAFWWGASLLEEASVITRGCCRTAGNMSPLWKLLGDIEVVEFQLGLAKLAFISGHLQSSEVG